MSDQTTIKARLNGWLRIAIVVGGILVTVATAYATLRARVEDNTNDIKVVTIKAEASEKAVIGIQKDIEYIKKSTDKILKKLED